jgi:DNA-binding beta-propeller fold protein YncE
MDGEDALLNSGDSGAGAGPSGATGGTSAGDGDQVDPNEPEMELEETFRAPVVSGKYLWSANPDTNQVARIHAERLEIEVMDGGHAPTFLAALPPGKTEGGALILNALSHDASIFLTDKDDKLLPPLQFPVQEGASAWTVGAKGSYAIAWSRADENLLNSGDGYQDLTVFDFTGKQIQSRSLSVGYRPSRVVIDAAEKRAFVVSAPGISIIDLESGGSIEREIFLPAEKAGQARDVSITKDGRLALVRITGTSEILLIDTESDARATVTLPGPVTDLDLSEDGSVAIAVVRGGQTDVEGLGGAGGEGNGSPEDSVVAILPIDTIFAEPTQFETVVTSETVGSAVVSSDASQVLLFTNASTSSRLSVLSTSENTLRVVDVKAPIRAAFLADDGSYGVTLMSPPAGSSKQGAFALVPVRDAFSMHMQGTSTAPEFVTISHKSGRALITTKDAPGQRAFTYFARFPGLQIDAIELPSRPLASGLVPDAGKGFVAQHHPEGRVTFIDMESGTEKTVTGFELSGKVVD